MKKLFIALLLVMPSLAAAQATPICYDMGKQHYSGLMGRWDTVGDFNTKGKGTCAWLGNRFTQQCFDYDVCRKYDTAANCQWALNQGSAAYQDTAHVLDCNNMQARWYDNYGAGLTIGQPNPGTSMTGILNTNVTVTPCGYYYMAGYISGDGVMNVTFTHQGTAPENCFASFSYYGQTFGSYSNGTWRNTYLGQPQSGEYVLFRQDPLIGNPNSRAMRPTLDPGKGPWRKY